MPAASHPHPRQPSEGGDVLVRFTHKLATAHQRKLLKPRQLGELRGDLSAPPDDKRTQATGQR